jgi:hypothetical protein
MLTTFQQSEHYGQKKGIDMFEKEREGNKRKKEINKERKMK